MTQRRATITAIRPLVCDTGQGRTFLFVLVDTDQGVTGVGEGSQNDQDAAVVANVRQLAPGYVGHDPAIPHEIAGPAAERELAAAYRVAFPDLAITIEDQIAEDDRVVTRWTARGTHLGAFRGIPPSGKQVSLTGINIIRVAGGKAVEGWMSLDELGLLRQLGAMPAAPAAHGPGPFGRGGL
jgi:steroid delta-isomerase-like uncharacterized protein